MAAMQKTQRSLEQIEDIILGKIFLVSLVESGGRDSKNVYLEMTAAEILSEGMELRISSDLMERILIDRLSGNFRTSEPPFPYLVGCYLRAHEEMKKVSAMRDKSARSEIESSVRQAKKLSVSYCRIHLANHGMFPDWDFSGTVPGVSSLLPLIYSEVMSSVDVFGGSSTSGGIMCPPGFLQDFFMDSDVDSLDTVLKGLYETLKATVSKVSALGNFHQPLRALLYLVKLPTGAKSLVSHRFWIGELRNANGRFLEMSTILGCFLHVSALPDRTFFKSEPDVGQQCFSNSTTRRSADLLSSFTTIRTVMNNLYDGMNDVLLILLKNPGTREDVLEYLATAINLNSSRDHIQVNPLSCASSGMFVNLSAVMLKLCEPFLDSNLSKRCKIDHSYVFESPLLNFRELTSLHASSEEVSEWMRKKKSRTRTGEAAASSSGSSNASAVDEHGRPKYSFICECFFMTSRVLRLGLLKALSDYKHLVQDISRCEDTLKSLKDLHSQSPSSSQLVLDIGLLEKEIEMFTQDKLCYEAQILRDDLFIRRALSYYLLMLTWLVDMVGGFKMPLPAVCPMDFACMPEHFIEDAMELLIFASRIPKALEGVFLEDFMNFIIMFMASPKFIKNPYLRAKMVEVLNYWIPQRSGSSVAASLFDGHQLSLEYLVKNLLNLYIDIEFTGSHNQFFDKFNIRHNIAELLEYLWQVPSHRNAWRQIAKEEERGVYLNFLNFLVNDSIYLLDESLNKILELKELEAEISDKEGRERLSSQERQERTRRLHSQQNIVRIDMKLANEDVSVLVFTSEQITAPFLLPEMVERVAGMLNYFLLQLVGPQRKSLTLKDPEKYEFRPRQLLRQIVLIYVHLARGDHADVFPAAVSADGRSYNDHLFAAAAAVLARIDIDPRVAEEFVRLGHRVKLAASAALDTDEILGDIPDEFLDPIQYTLMKDPVTLPSNVTVDRAVIQRHLLSDSNDPFSRAHLTSDMLIPNKELKGRIQEFVRARELGRRGDVIHQSNTAKDTIRTSSSDSITFIK